MPDPLADHEQRVRACPGQSPRFDLHEGAVARATAAGHGEAAARHAPGRLGEGLLRRRADQPGHVGRSRAHDDLGDRARPGHPVRAGGQAMTHTLAYELAAGGAGAVKGGEAAVFFILAPIAVICGIGMVAARNAVHSALFLVVTMLCLGVFYVLEAGPFIGLVQIIVYTGAIMMLFLFVLMLVGRDSSDSLIETPRGH